MNHWGHFLAAAAALLALGALLVAHNWAHQSTTGDLYSAYVRNHWAHAVDQLATVAPNTFFATTAQQEILRSAVHDGARRAQALNFETNIWGGIFVVILLVVLTYHAYSLKTLF